jgi:hypothetical protein
VVEDRCSFPRERLSVLSEIPLAVQTFIKSVEQTPVEDLIKAFEKLELMLEDNSVGLVEVRRNLDNDRPLFYLPKDIEDPIGNHHDIGLILIIRLLINLFIACLMHIPKHLER